MTIELRMLGTTILLGLISLALASVLSTRKRGTQWNAGNREEQLPALTGVAGRAQRASANLLETFPFFAAAVLAVVLAERTSASTAIGAELYFWARVVYLPVYLIGVPYLRSLVWVVALVGLLMVTWGLF